jgi:phenylalanyl-tRNA synthetase alpha chain
MNERIRDLFSRFDAEVATVSDRAALKAARDRWLGRKAGIVTEVRKSMGAVPPEERAAFGKAYNELAEHVESSLEALSSAFAAREVEAAVARETVDVTLPGRRTRRGHLHPITLLRHRLEDIFARMGYSVEDGPEIETTFYNFDALNIPDGHPARESQDTMYVSADVALRSQTSNVQIHAMQRRRPPIRIVAPGRVFRRDTPDPTHNPMFFQIEGLNIGEGITMADLRGTCEEFVRQLFGEGAPVRFSPSYFPFVEPGAQFDYGCFVCHGEAGQSCRLCKGSGWIEMGGCGMVHPNVLRAVDIDPQRYQGFAFGFGLDRLAARLFDIDDIRLLYTNDVRFLEQF